jgi:peptidoglycan/LPS O-acetylase OafA/YrhL/lysophospholipase L1-like esterase
MLVGAGDTLVDQILGGVFSFGAYGVTLFFVLSGFLITSLLLAEWDGSGRIDLRRFWSRRFRRLLPAALVLLVGAGAIAGLTLSSPDLHRFRGDALAALADVANWHAIGAGNDYWAATAAPSPLQHMWSLSIEEQLYLAWPLVVLGALALGRRQRVGRQPLVVVALAGVALSVAAMAWWSTHGEDLRAYYGTDSRASAILLGALMALLVSGQRRGAGLGLERALRPAVPLAVAVLAAGWLWADGTSDWLYRGGFAAMSLAAAVVVGAVALAGPNVAMRGLAWPPLRWLGRVSYGVYLWHWPIYTVIDGDAVSSRAIRTLVRIGVTLVVAAISYRIVEQPIRRGEVRTAAWRVLAPLGAAAVVATTLIVTHGSQARPAVAAVGGPSRPGSGLPTLLLLGDSEAYNLTLGRSAIEDRVSFAYHARIGCGIGPGLAITEGGVAVEHDLSGAPCTEANHWLFDAVDRYRPDIVLVYEGAWDVLDRRIDGRDIAFGTPEWDQVVSDNLAAVLRRFGAHGARVEVLAAPCYPAGGQGGGFTIRDDTRRSVRWNQLLRQVAPTVGAEVLPYDLLFCDRPPAEQPPREDGVHLTEAGAEQVWRWLLPRLGLPGG